MTEGRASLTMIQLRPDVPRAMAWMLSETRRIVRPGHDDGYGWHALLAAAFGEYAPKPFRIVERPGRPVQFLAYTDRTKAELLERAVSFATPDVYTALGIDRMDEKPMPALFRAGHRLSFEVRVRPTVRQDRDGDRRKSREKDAFLAAVDALPPRGERADIQRADVYRGWLAARLAGAATLEDRAFRLVHLRRTMLLRPTQRGDREVRPVGLLRKRKERGEQEGYEKSEQGGSPDTVLGGTLIVTDPDAFMALLARGIGRHRAFGFGMLLLRPPRERVA